MSKMEKAVEAAARGLCRVRIKNNTIIDQIFNAEKVEARDANFEQRAEDAGWQNFISEAEAALLAALPHLPHPAPDREKVAELICERMDDGIVRCGSYPMHTSASACACWGAADAILALLSPAREKVVEGWRNIASAPKDGEHIQGIDAAGRQFVMRWNPQLHPVDDKEGWFGTPPDHYRRNPTHWQPLPASSSGDR